MRQATVVLVLVACVALAVLATRARGAGEPGISDEQRAATLRFDPTVEPADRVWIEAAIAHARPEAQRLIAEVDGLVDVRTDLDEPPAIGLTSFRGDSITVNFDTGLLNGDRAIDRDIVVLHELGHVIDVLLVDDATMGQLDAGIPAAGACMSASQLDGACTAVEERFADTFAKWAVRGRFSLAGSGYGIPTPPSLEDWGGPLGALSLRLGR